jgi:putative FmdB family regulatory protein
MPIYSFICLACGHAQDEICKNRKDVDELACESCGSLQLQMQMPLLGGYKITGNNGASVTPKKAGSFGGKKQ